jgi:hypothetical protein
MGATGAGDFCVATIKFRRCYTIQRHLSLQKDCGAILPPIFDTCEVMQLADGLLTLSAPNAALATKLKQQCPKLLKVCKSGAGRLTQSASKYKSGGS